MVFQNKQSDSPLGIVPSKKMNYQSSLSFGKNVIESEMFPGDAHETSSESSNYKTWFRAATRSAPQSSSMNKPSKNNFAVVCFPYCSTRLGCFIILPQAAM
jgi:hypothetical protein